MIYYLLGAGAVWFLGCFSVARHLTSRATPRFDEGLPDVPWARFRSLRIPTADGEELGAWLDETPDRSSPVVLITHGNGGHRAAALHVAEAVAGAGYRSLLITHRAHGDSTGNRNDFGFSARHDIVAAVAQLERLDPAVRTVVWGRSLGAAAAIFAAPQLEGRVAGLILECPYRDLLTAIWHRTENSLPPVLSHAAFFSLRSVAPLVIPHIDQISPEQGAAAVPSGIPVMILCGGKDLRARPFEAEAIHRAMGQRSRLVLLPEGGHLQLHRPDAAAYRSEVLGFLREIRARTENEALHSRSS